MSTSSPGRPCLPNDADVHEAHAALGNGAYLLDVRSSAEYESGHAPEAGLIPLPSLGDRLGEVPRDRPVYVICHSGGRSAIAARQLAEAGHADVTKVRGGMSAWIRAGLPVEPAQEGRGVVQNLLSGRLWPRFGR